MRDPINFRDHVVQYPNRFRMTNLGGDLIQLDKEPGEIIQQGTPLNGTNMNALDLAAIQADTLAVENSLEIRWLKDRTDAQEGEQIQVTLTNKQTYPFNDSQKAISLTKNRNRKNYTVLAEVVSSVGGGIGEISITDKMLNGFKVSYSGAASSVTLILVVQGGY